MRITLHLCFFLCTFWVISLVKGQSSQQQQPSSANSQIKIPWGFQWGETQLQVERSLRSAKTVITEQKKIGNREVLVTSGFIQHLLLQALFYFQDGRLNEIELQYGEKSWDLSHYQDFFDQTRSNIETKYGPGRLLAQQKNNQEDQGVHLTMTGYQWTQTSATLQVFFFTAEKDTNSFQLVSLHYRGF